MSRHPAKLICDKAFRDNGKIRCGLNGKPCAHTRYSGMNGWWEQTAAASNCALPDPPDQPDKSEKGRKKNDS